MAVLERDSSPTDATYRRGKLENPTAHKVKVPN